MTTIDLRISVAAHDLHEHPVEWLAPPDDLWGRIETELKVIPFQRPATSRRRTTPSLSWLAAAALIVIGGVVAVVVSQQNNPAPAVVATAALQHVDAPTGEVSAQLIRTSSGYKLKVAMKDMPEVPQGSSVELWMADPSMSIVRELGSLPSVPAGTTVIDLPADIDPSQLSLIDLSLEPNDLDPTHSSTTLLQGVLA